MKAYVLIHRLKPGTDNADNSVDADNASKAGGHHPPNGQNQGRILMRPRLRLFTGEPNETFEAPPAMTISFGELMKIIDDATHAKRSWISDFSHDDVMITEDLYEVMTEYARLRPGA